MALPCDIQKGLCRTIMPLVLKIRIRIRIRIRIQNQNQNFCDLCKNQNLSESELQNFMRTRISSETEFLKNWNFRIISESESFENCSKIEALEKFRISSFENLCELESIENQNSLRITILSELNFFRTMSLEKR